MQGMDRRQFGSIMLGLATTAGLDRLQVPDRVDMAHVRYIRATIDRLYRQDQSLGGGALAQSALRQYRRARRMLNEADYSDRVGSELILAVGDLAVCVGWLCYDNGNQPLARELYSDALLLANQSRNDELSVRVLEKMALQSVFVTWNGNARIGAEAVRLAQGAADLSRRSPHAQLHALIAGREAIGRAIVGDERGFERAIARARNEIDRSDPSDDVPVWLQFVNHSEIDVHEARGKLFLGDATASVELFSASLDNQLLSQRNRANYQAQLAASLARSGDVSTALNEGSRALSILEGQVISPRTLIELQAVREMAQEQGDEEFCVRHDLVVSGMTRM